MPELAALDNYRGSDPDLVVIHIEPDFVSGPDAEVVLYTTAAPSLWRVRVVMVKGRITGTVGTAQLSLAFSISASANLPWVGAANDSELVAGSPQVLNPADDFAYTWSTEVGTNYLGKNFQYGRTAQLGLPLVFLPGATDIALNMTDLGGFDGDLVPRDGFIQIEKFPPSAAQAGGDQLPDLSPVWYLTEDAT